MLSVTTNKPATKLVIKKIEQSRIALSDMALAIVLKDSGENALHQAFEVLRKTKVTIGSLQASKTVPACSNALFFRDTLVSQVSPKTGKNYTPATASNYLTDFRKALKNGGELVLNSARKTATEKAKVKPIDKTITATEIDNEAIVDIPSATPKTGAQKLYGTLNTALLIAQNDENPSYDVVRFTKQLNALIAMLPAS
jgi:hypothetical protein